MKLAYVTMFDANNIRNWSGLYWYMHKSLENQGVKIELIGNLEHGRSVSRRVRKLWAQNVEQKDFLHFWDLDTARDYCADVDRRLSALDVDGVVSPSLCALAFLKSNLPKILWTDAAFSGLSQLYDEFNPTLISKASSRHARQLERLTASNCDLLIFASEWAAESAVNANQSVNSAKVGVVPFGANFSVTHTAIDVENFVLDRNFDVIKLLFVGVDWERKGGDKAIQIAANVEQAGFKVELTIVGCSPPDQLILPKFVRVIGRLDKSVPEEREHLRRLFSTSHFLLLPTKAEAYGLVFAEASAFGVPSLSHQVGGVPTVVKENLNGFLFELTAPVDHWSECITSIFMDKNRLRELSLTSFREYQERLNWQVAGEHAVQLIKPCLEFAT